MKTLGKHKTNLLSIPYTERDILILYAVFAFRYMTTTQIWRLFFPHTSLLVCNQRLKKLVDYGLLRVIELAVRRGEGRRPYIYAITPLGGELLVQERGVDSKLINVKPWSDEGNNLKLKHTLLTTDCLIAINEACKVSDFTLEAWQTEREIRSQLTKETTRFAGADGRVYRTPVADLLVTLERNGKQALCWIEADRGTEMIELSTFERQSVSAKTIEYIHYEQSTDYHTEFRSETGIRPLRVLFITTGERRMNNMKAAAEKVIEQQLRMRTDLTEEAEKAERVRIGKRFRFLTFEHMQPVTLLTQPIWAVAGSDTLQTILE